MTNTADGSTILLYQLVKQEFGKLGTKLKMRCIRQSLVASQWENDTSIVGRMYREAPQACGWFWHSIQEEEIEYTSRHDHANGIWKIKRRPLIFQTHSQGGNNDKE